MEKLIQTFQHFFLKSLDQMDKTNTIYTYNTYIDHHPDVIYIILFYAAH